jgi:small subunit ribosomal protein S20
LKGAHLPVKKRSLTVLKNARRSERRRKVNRGRKSRLKIALKSMKAAKTKTEAQELLAGTQAVVDKSVRRGIIHRNTAARLKSKLARGVAKLA